MKKLLALLVAAALFAVPVLASAEDAQKDETIYTLLTATGEQKQVLVVSHIDTPTEGTYTDYGTYESISAMTEDISPTVEGDTTTWQLPANNEGFFAVGTMEDAQVPFTFLIGYTLDGAAIEPADLAGKSGHVEITIDTKANPDAEAYFRTKYLAQIQVPLSVQVASNIEAAGATSALVGQTQTLTFTVLPGQDATQTIAFDATDFSMDGITIACAPMDIEGMLGLNLSDLTGEAGTLTEGAHALADGGKQLADGLTTMAESTQTLADGAAQLPTGVNQLADGMSQLSTALSGLPAQMTSLSDGSQALTTGVTDYVNGADAAIKAVASLSTALGDLSSQGALLNSSIEQIGTALAPILQQMPEDQRIALQGELAALTEGFAQYTGGISEVSTQVSTLAESTKPLTDGSKALTDGLAQQNTGIQTLATSMTALSSQLPDTTSLNTLKAGTKQVADGIGTLNEAVQALPEQAQKLADGQKEMADGLDTAIASLSDLPLADDEGATLTSFASPGHAVRSVQFVYMTDAVRLPAAEKPVVEEAAPESFWERLTALF